jgi:hypothetical protein
MIIYINASDSLSNWTHLFIVFFSKCSTLLFNVGYHAYNCRPVAFQSNACGLAGNFLGHWVNFKPIK